MEKMENKKPEEDNREVRYEIEQWRRIYRQLGLEEGRINEIIAGLSLDFKVELKKEEKEKIREEIKHYREKIIQEQKEIKETERRLREAQGEEIKELYREMLIVKNKNIDYLKNFISMVENLGDQSDD